MKRKRILIGAVSFLTMAGILALMLHSINWVPTLVTSGFVKQYPDIEDARRALGIKNVPVPTYFPENISWPPTLVIAQGHPYPAISMEFKSVETSESMLLIARSPVGRKPLLSIGIETVTEEVRYDLQGRSALLQTGSCRAQSPCSMITWEDAGQHTSVLLHERPFELIKIAESMHH